MAFFPVQQKSVVFFDLTDGEEHTGTKNLLLLLRK